MWFVTTATRIPPDQCIPIGPFFICNSAGKFTHHFRDYFYGVLLTILFMFVPRVFRILARWEGTIQRTQVELSIMDRVFVINIIVRACYVVPHKRFLHVQQGGLLIPTLSTFLFAVPSGVRVVMWSDSLTNPYAGAIIQDLTSSSTFFLT